MTAVPFFSKNMLSFNELYITEDGKNLVIDVSVDDLAAYSECYINKITVNTADGHCKSKEPVDVFSGSTGVTYVDIDGDGVISESDVEQIDWLQSILHRIAYSDEFAKYDVNKDGFIDLKDYVLIRQKILDNSTDLVYDIDGTGSVNIGDINAWVQGLLTLFESEICGLSSCDMQLAQSIWDKYDTLIQSRTSLKSEGTAPVHRKRLCLVPQDLAELGFTKSIAGQLLVVRAEAVVNGNITMIESLGCGWDENVITGVAYDGKPLYDAAVRYASTFGGSCDSSDSSSFTDFILRYYAFDFALRNGDICKALQYWNEYLNSTASTGYRGSGKGCGCHGTY